VFTSCDYRFYLGIPRGFFLSRPPVYNPGAGSEVRNDYKEKALTWLEALNLETNACRRPHLRKASAKPRIAPGDRCVRTHRSSEVNRDEEFLLALVSFPLRGIHCWCLDQREIGAQLPASTTRGAKAVDQMFQIVPLWKPRKPGTVQPRLWIASRQSCQPWLRVCISRPSDLTLLSPRAGWDFRQVDLWSLQVDRMRLNDKADASIFVKPNDYI